jgi:hypothetical protein
MYRCKTCPDELASGDTLREHELTVHTPESIGYWENPTYYPSFCNGCDEPEINPEITGANYLHISRRSIRYMFVCIAQQKQQQYIVMVMIHTMLTIRRNTRRKNSNIRLRCQGKRG